VLAVRSVDPVMSLLGPIGLAASLGTALVVDASAGARRGTRTLADIARDGPRLDELSPGRAGVAVIASGDLAAPEIEAVVGRLATRWPAVAVRIGGLEWDGPTVPLRPLYPGALAPEPAGAAVWQPVAGGSRPPGPGPVLPRLRPSLVRRVLAGAAPNNGRWVRSWRQVWELPWA
jgi:hypothetical protein